MITLVSIDPGVHRCGVALWEKGVLNGAILTEHVPVERVAGLLPIWHNATYLIELPQIYSRRASGKGDPNDLIMLAVTIGTIVGRLSVKTFLSPGVEIKLIKPREWKGQAPKNVTEARVKLALTNRELDRVDLPRAKSLQHNVFDAIGIGLWYLKKQGAR